MYYNSETPLRPRYMQLGTIVNQVAEVFAKDPQNWTKILW